MTRLDLVDVLAQRCDLPRYTAEEVVNIIFEQMVEALRCRERIELRGFGSFRIRAYDGYVGRNPRTRQPIRVRPKVLPVFRVGKELRERVNRGGA